MKYLLYIAIGLAIAYALIAGFTALIGLWLNRRKHDQP